MTNKQAPETSPNGSELEGMDCNTRLVFEVDEINFLANSSQRFFSWCGFDFDLYTLDVYL
jgi:hypothetical protein